MNRFPEYITLNGVQVPVKECIQNKQPKTERESELRDFLAAWYSDIEYLEVETSGSTGPPKTIRLKKDFVAASAIRTLHFFGLKKNDRILHCLPMKYIAGKLMVVRALLGDLNLCIHEPSTDFSFLKTEKFRFSAMVPHQVRKIVDNEPSPGMWLQHIEQVLMGGSAVPRELEKQLKNIPVACYSGYALTETATHIALRPVNGKEADGWYHCLENIHVSKSAEGCLQIFMPGLDTLPLQTTDLAELKDEKTFRILGRTDHVIICGGIKYSPEQIEKKLEPFIAGPFLISSLPHESLGRQLVLVTEGKENDHSAVRLREICRKHLQKREQPRQIIFLPEIPCNTNGKPDRIRLQHKIESF